MDFWQFKFKSSDWYDWDEVTVGHIEDWKFPRLKKYKDIAVGDIVFVYRTDKKKDRGIHFVAKIVSIDMDLNHPIDLEIIIDLKDNIFKPEDFGFSKLISKINLLGQNGSIYKIQDKDNPLELYDLIKNSGFRIPEELNQKDVYNLQEGARTQIVVNSYERNTKARNACIAQYGYDCSVCGCNFENMYGKLGKDFIHVHHIKPLSKIKKSYKINPIKDLRPVCPNCHAMLHKDKNKTLSINELKDITKSTWEDQDN